MRSACFVACSVMLGGCAWTQRTTTVSEPTPTALAALHSFLEREADVHGLPSIAVAVADRNRIIAGDAVGLANRNENRRADIDTYYRIGSVTKLFTGTLLLILRDQGKLGLDDPVAKFVPEIEGVVHPAGDRTQITIRHLVTHKSGLPRDLPASAEGKPGEPITDKKIVAALHGQALVAVPGTTAIYSNQAMALVGVVLARAAGRPFRQAMQENLLTPFDIKCVWDDKDVPREHLAEGYALGSSDDKAGERSVGDGMESAGGLYCSARELARFGQLFLHIKPDGDERTLKATSRAEAMREHINWGCHEKKPTGMACGHNGLIDDYAASLHLFAVRGVVVVALTNAAAIEALASLDRRIAAGLFVGTPWKRLATPEVPVFPDEARAHYQAVLDGPATMKQLQSHFVADQFNVVGGVAILANAAGGTGQWRAMQGQSSSRRGEGGPVGRHARLREG